MPLLVTPSLPERRGVAVRPKTVWRAPRRSWLGQLLWGDSVNITVPTSQ